MILRRKISTALVALGLVFGGLVIAGPSASAAGPVAPTATCGTLAWNWFNGFDGALVQTCSGGARVRYTINCVIPLPDKTVDVTFPAGGASMVTDVPACQTGISGASWRFR